MAKEIVVSHVRDITLGKRTYHYLLSGLVRIYWAINLKNRSNDIISIRSWMIDGRVK